MAEMTRRRQRHLPVLEHGRLVGIVSVGDLVKNRLDELELETHMLRGRLRGATVRRSLKASWVVPATTTVDLGPARKVAVGWKSGGAVERLPGRCAMSSLAARPSTLPCRQPTPGRRRRVSAPAGYGLVTRSGGRG